MRTEWSKTGVVLEEGCRLPVTRDQVQCLAGRWLSVFEYLWQDVVTLAGDVWAADDARRLGRWHHFLMAVGNFKRQGGTIIYPANEPLIPASGGDASPRTEIHVPVRRGVQLLLEHSEAGSWQRWQESVPGLGVPTATTALSALWPGYHVIIDQRDLRGAVGLLVAASCAILGDPASSQSLDPPGWADYIWFRSLLVSEASRLKVDPVEVERALFFAEGLVESEEGRTWREYGRRLVEAIEEACRS